MSDLPEPDAYRRTTVEDPGGGGGCGAPWFWIILFIIALLVITALVIVLVYAIRRTTKGSNLEFKGAVIKVGKDNSTLTATWPSTNKTSDKVTLWATLDPPEFDTLGKVLNSNAKSSQAASGVNTTTLTGLDAGIKYYATVTVFNDDTYNYQLYTQIVYMDGTTPVTNVPGQTAVVEVQKNTFAIEDIIQVGKIQLVEDGSIRFNQRPSEANSLWYVNSDGQIAHDENTTVCLYNNNGVLASEDCSTLKTSNLQNSKWTYNGGKLSNQWCLSSTINNDKPSCMVLEGISNGSATVSVKSDVNAGDAWANAFEVSK